MTRRVLITGATSGIGEQFAHYYAKRQDECYVVGRNQAKLDELAKEYHCQTYVVDLSDKQALNEFIQNIQDIPFDIVINNAGLGYSSRFEDIPSRKIDELIATNVSALTKICHAVIPQMKKQKKGYILNIASMGSFFPGPYLAVYYATKAYVHSLTLALSAELKTDNITVSALYPGPIRTNFFVRAEFKDQHGLGKLITHDSEALVQVATRKMKKQKRMIIPFLSDKALYIAYKLVPIRCILYLVEKIQRQRTE